MLSTAPSLKLLAHSLVNTLHPLLHVSPSGQNPFWFGAYNLKIIQKTDVLLILVERRGVSKINCGGWCDVCSGKGAYCVSLMTWVQSPEPM